MVDKRARKFANIVHTSALRQLEGPEDAEVLLIGWGSTYVVIKEAISHLAKQGITANQLSVKWIVPFHTEAVTNIINNARHTIMIENNYSGQFFRYLRSETGLNVNGHIRKYDEEPFMHHHIVDGVKEKLTENNTHYVPTQEIMV